MEDRGRTKVQMLYDACNEVFSAHKEQLPTFQQIRWLKTLMDTMESADVGINEFGPGFPSSSPDWPKGLISAHEVSKITRRQIGMFCFPAGATFPPHDHPGMTVLSKLLYGSVYVTAYDWIKIEESNTRTIGLAGTVMDGVMKSPCQTSVLFPRSGGNIHSFTALTPCAILDVLSPPYSEELGRPSTYFLDFPIPSLPGYVVLEERDLPEDLEVAGAPCLGPPVVTVEDDLC